MKKYLKTIRFIFGLIWYFLYLNGAFYKEVDLC
jgi:hypothetical protein